jgi:hypothetical protein
MSMRLACLFLAVLLLSSGCWSGPWRLTNSWEDKTQDWYSNNAWVHGALLSDIVPAYPFVWLVMFIGDAIAVNPWYFWTHDAWTNKGTAFSHTQPSGPATVDNVFGGGTKASGWAPKK